MEHVRRGTSVRTKSGVMFMLMGLLSGLLAIIGPSVSAEPLNPGTLGGFETEGDQNDATLNTGTIDWETVKTDPRITEWALIHDDGDVDTNDSSYIDSAKEQDPSTWGCAANESPPKDDIFRLYLATQVTPQNQYLHIGYVRATGTGDTDINLEFNRASGQFSCPGDTGGRVRSRDDLMLSFTFGGGNDPSEINAYRWDTTAVADNVGDPPPSATGSDFNAGDGHWDLVSLAPIAAVGADNAAGAVLDQFFDDSSLGSRTFGELTIDIGALLDGIVGCPGFGFVTGHSRASHSFASDLKDIFPETQFDLSDCAKIRIKKVDNSVPPVAQQGAVYGLYDSLAKAQAVAGQSDADAKAAARDWCTTGSDGTCLLDKADPEKDHWITEIAPPAGLLPSTEVRAVTASEIEPFASLDLTGAPFVNNVPVGNVTIAKRLFEDNNNNGILDPGEQVAPDQASDLDGIMFTLRQNGVVSKTHPANQDASCTITGGNGQCTISSVRLGTYQIAETLNPNGPSGIGVGSSPSVTITTNGQTVNASYDNPLSPINIALDKLGDRDQANIGDTVNYTFTVTTTGVRLHDVALAEWEGVLVPVTYADICDSGPTFDAALSSGEQDGFLNATDAFVWRCPHLVTGTDPDPLPNRARATGTDDVGRTAEAFDVFVVDILRPDLQVVKLAADGVDAGSIASSDETVDAPGTASYTITITNLGAGTARNVTLTDTLPAGGWTITQTSPSDVGDICPNPAGNPKSGSFTCTFGDLAANASKTVTVSRAVTRAADCAAVLTNNAGVTTTYRQVGIDPNSANDSSAAIVRVRCPDVGVVKSAQSTPINAGDRAAWTITVTNNGAGVATGVHLTDTIPRDLTDARVGGANASDCGLDGNLVSCDFGDMAPNDGAPGGADTRVITVSGLTDAADCATIPNTANVVNADGGVYVDTNAANNASTATVEVQCPDVYADKSGPAEVSAGDKITWSITFGNYGPGDAYDATVTDNLPARVTDYQLTDPDGVCDLTGSTVTCSFEVLEVGQAYTIAVTGSSGTSPQACGDAVNPVSISASNEPLGVVRQNNTDSVTTDVECPNVDLVKVADEPSTSASEPVGFSIRVRNAAGEDVGIARDVVVTDALPDIRGYTWGVDDVVSEETDACSLDGRALSCAFGHLSPGESASVHLVATQDGKTDPEDACGTYSNTGVVRFGNGVEADRTDNSDSVTILCPGVNLGKVADDDLVEAGDQIGFSITVSNIDDRDPPPEGDARDVVVTDELPGGLAWEVADDSDLPEGADCSIDAGVLTCELGDLPAIDGADAPQVTVHVVADTTGADCGVYDNTASATVANGADPDDAEATSRVRCPISIALDKTGDARAHVGDVVDYEFTATNAGGEDLLGLQLNDPECDANTVVLTDDGDGDAVLAAGTWDSDARSFAGGEVWTYTCARTLTAPDVVIVDGQDVALNTGAIRGEDADGREANDTDPHVVEIITPAIEVVKTVDDDTPNVGQTVTFTYVVTNTGDTPLVGVEVVDDRLGPVGTVDELAVGASITLTKTMVVVSSSPNRNTATATGEDVLGKVVTDDDVADITIVAGSVTLPRTGAESAALLAAAALLLVNGALLVMMGTTCARRSRRQRVLL